MRKSITIVEIGLTNQMMVLYAWYCFSSTEAISLAWSCGLLLTNHITVFRTKWLPSCPQDILPSCPHADLVNKVVDALSLSYSSLHPRLKGPVLLPRLSIYNKVNRLLYVESMNLVRFDWSLLWKTNQIFCSLLILH